MKFSIFILIVSTLSLTANASPTNLKNRRSALGASLDKRRFGVEHTSEADATFQEVKDIAQGTDKEAQAGNLSGAMVRALLAKAPACDQQDRADEVIDLGDQLGGDKRAQLVKVAQTYRQLERNTPNAGQPSELCNKKPKHKELDGLVQAQDPTGTNQDPNGNTPQNSTGSNQDPTGNNPQDPTGNNSTGSNQDPTVNNPQNSTESNQDPTQDPNGNSTSAYPDMPKDKKGKGKDKKGKGKDKKGKGKDKKGKGKKGKGKGKKDCKKMDNAADASNNGTGLDNGTDSSNNGTDSSNNDCNMMNNGKKMDNGDNKMGNCGKMMDNGGTMNNNGSDPSSDKGKKNDPSSDKGKKNDPSNKGADPSDNGTDPSTNGTAATTDPTSNTDAQVNNDAFKNPVAGVQMPPIIQDKTSNRPFSVKGDTFVNIGAAQGRQCDVQHNGCANAVNSGSAQGVSVGDCDKQTDVCKAGEPFIQQKQN